MSDLGENWATTKDPGTTDFGSLLSLLMFCNHFKIRQSRLEAVKYWKYTWIRRTRSQTFTDKEKKDAFTDIDNLMTARELESIKEVQECRQTIKEIEKEEKDLKISWKSPNKKLAREEIKIKETKEEIRVAEGDIEVAEGEVKETKEELEVAKEELEVAEEEIKETKDEIKETKEEMKVTNNEMGVVRTILLYIIYSVAVALDGISHVFSNWSQN
jgi:DNA repair exonuclease SbcCD ATPase subunit